MKSEIENGIVSVLCSTIIPSIESACILLLAVTVYQKDFLWLGPTSEKELLDEDLRFQGSEVWASRVLR